MLKNFCSYNLPVDGHNMDKQLGHSIPLPYRYASTSSFIMEETQVLLAVSLWLSGVVIDQTFKDVASLFVVAEVSPSTVKAMVWYITNYHKGDLRFCGHDRHHILKISRLVSNVRKLFLHQNFPN